LIVSLFLALAHSYPGGDPLALGSIATPEVLPILQEYRNDQKRVVKESCDVALDMYEYENSNQFQYADGLSKVKE